MLRGFCPTRPQAPTRPPHLLCAIPRQLHRGLPKAQGNSHINANMDVYPEYCEETGLNLARR